MKYMHLYFMIYFTIFSILPQKILKNKILITKNFENIKMYLNGGNYGIVKR